MNRHVKFYLFILLIFAQLLILNQYPHLRLSIDFLYLIIVYMAVKKGFIRAVIAAILLGLLTDYLSMRVMGVFSFSRVLITFFIMEVSRFIDMRKNIFLFLFIFISLFFSNLVAFLFFRFVFGFRISRFLLLIQPLTTALAGTFILMSSKIKNILHVY